MTADESAGLTALHRIAAEFADGPDVELGTMFRSPGLRVGRKIFAFLGSGNRLIVKLPRPRALELLAMGTVTEVTMGTRTMREWIAIPLGDDPTAGTELWRHLASEAHDHVRALDA